MKNLHVPLPEPVHAKLRAAAEATGRPATEVARDAIERWLAELARDARRRAVAEYAAAVAGTDADLDPALERAAVASLRGRRTGRKKA